MWRERGGFCRPLRPQRTDLFGMRDLFPHRGVIKLAQLGRVACMAIHAALLSLDHHESRSPRKRFIHHHLRNRIVFPAPMTAFALNALQMRLLADAMATQALRIVAILLWQHRKSPRMGRFLPNVVRRLMAASALVRAYVRRIRTLTQGSPRSPDQRDRNHHPTQPHDPQTMTARKSRPPSPLSLCRVTFLPQCSHPLALSKTMTLAHEPHTHHLLDGSDFFARYPSNRCDLSRVAIHEPTPNCKIPPPAKKQLTSHNPCAIPLPRLGRLAQLVRVLA